jgi:hypothetical protein
MPRVKLVMDDSGFIKWVVETYISKVQVSFKKTNECFFKRLKDEEEEEAIRICNELHDLSIQASESTGQEVKNYDDEHADDMARRIVECLKRAFSKEIDALED